jgi:CHASE3 domain sensor protein
MTINHKIIGGYVVILALLVLVAGVAFYALRQTQTTYDHFLNVDERLLEGANELRTVTFAQQTYVRGILLYPELRQLNQTLLDTNDHQFKQILEKMRRLMRSEEGIALVNELESLQQQLTQAQHGAVRLALDQKNEEAIEYTIREFRPRSLALVEKAKQF